MAGFSNSERYRGALIQEVNGKWKVTKGDSVIGTPFGTLEQAKRYIDYLGGAKDSSPSNRRARLHRALDAVMDELPVEVTSKKVALQRYNSAERAYSEAGHLYNGKIPPHIKEWMERAKKELAAAK